MAPGTATIIAVGACAIDTILTVPHFPHEDAKLRAQSLTKRRGGNCPNTLEVLQQLILETRDADHQRRFGFVTDKVFSPLEPKLVLVASLPARTSPQTSFMISSFDTNVGSDVINDKPQPRYGGLRRSIVDCSYCIHREDHTEPVSSYIISSCATGSRTIVNYNDLEEMSLEEFKMVADKIMGSAAFRSKDHSAEHFWFHFEGRIPSTTLACIHYLRSHKCFVEHGSGGPLAQLRVSVELEKPGREGLQELAFVADAVFYSRSWAEGEGYCSATACLERQAEILRRQQTVHSREAITLVCTWGEQGACALQLTTGNNQSENTIVSCPAHPVTSDLIADAVGAGDTFIAGMLFSLICHSSISTDLTWSLSQALRLANELAGQKIMQLGFGGLGKRILPVLRNLDLEKDTA